MKTVYLVARKDDMTGTLGLVLEAAPRREETNSATSGLLIAHDLIEHQNGVARLGDIDDELEALGAIWECRGRWGDISRDGSGSMYTPQENIAADLTRMGVYVLNGAPFNVEPDALCTQAHESDDVFAEIIAISRRAIPLEFGAEEMTDEHRAELKRYLSAAMHLMRTGARKFRRRFKAPIHGNAQLWAIAQACDPWCASVEYEGQRYRLRYGNGEATCEEVYGDE